MANFKESDVECAEVIEHYYKQYGVGRGLISQAIQRYGDSEHTHHFLEFVKNVQENCPTYNKTFDEIIKDYLNNKE